MEALAQGRGEDPQHRHDDRGILVEGAFRRSPAAATTIPATAATAPKAAVAGRSQPPWQEISLRGAAQRQWPEHRHGAQHAFITGLVHRRDFDVFQHMLAVTAAAQRLGGEAGQGRSTTARPEKARSAPSFKPAKTHKNSGRNNSAEYILALSDNAGSTHSPAR